MLTLTRLITVHVEVRSCCRSCRCRRRLKKNVKKKEKITQNQKLNDDNIFKFDCAFCYSNYKQ